MSFPFVIFATQKTMNLVKRENTLLLLCLLPMLFLQQLVPAQTQLATGFNLQTIPATLNQPVGITFDDNGRGYIWEKAGLVYILEDGNTLPTPLLDISDEVGNFGDQGLLGFALDPDFLQNGYFYLLYVVDRYHLLNFGTPAYDPQRSELYKATIGRITRYTADVNNDFKSIVSGSRKILLGESKETGIPILYDSHGVGGLAFGTDGSLFASCGDGSTWRRPYLGGAPYPNNYVTTALTDGIITPEQDVGSFRAQQIDCLSGKVLRIDPATGDGFSSNPWYNPADPRADRSRVWALGFRNAFRIAVRPGSGLSDPDAGIPGTLYISDVGEATWEEINVADRPGLNFGWPAFEGMDTIHNYYDTITVNKFAPNPLFPGCGAEFFTFQELIRQDQFTQPAFEHPCDPNTSLDVPAFYHVRPEVSWKNFYSGGFLTYTAGFDSSGNALSVLTSDPQSLLQADPWRGFAAVGNTFYTGQTFPQDLQGQYFLADFIGYIRSFESNLNDEIIGTEVIYSDSFKIIDIATNPAEGCIYLIQTNNVIKKLCYGGNVPPIADLQVDTTYGPSPLTVQFDGSDSYDTQLSPLELEWDFGDGSPAVSDSVPTHTFSSTTDAPVSYTVTLTATDSAGLTAAEQVLISLNNTPPAVDITSIEEDFRYPSHINTWLSLHANVSDREHPDSDLSYKWETFLHHNEHFHTEPVDTNVNGQTFLTPAGCLDGVSYWYRIRLTVTDAAGLEGQDEVNIYPNCAPAIAEFTNLSAQPDGNRVLVDWSLAQSPDVARFYIERSPDNYRFKDAGWVDANGVATLYNFEDENAEEGRNYYRIRALSADNVLLYSESVEVIFDPDKAARVYPVPASDILNVHINKIKGEASLELFDVVGKKVASWTHPESGSQDWQVDLPQLRPGVYVYRIRNRIVSVGGRLLIE